jgi:hypothetical protein
VVGEPAVRAQIARLQLANRLVKENEEALVLDSLLLGQIEDRSDVVERFLPIAASAVEVDQPRRTSSESSPSQNIFWYVSSAISTSLRLSVAARHLALGASHRMVPGCPAEIDDLLLELDLGAG